MELVKELEQATRNCEAAIELATATQDYEIEFDRKIEMDILSTALEEARMGYAEDEIVSCGPWLELLTKYI